MNTTSLVCTEWWFSRIKRRASCCV